MNRSAAVFKLRLITAQRGGEVADVRWQDVDLDAGWWTIPAERAKNGLPHRVPLTPMAGGDGPREWQLLAPAPKR